MNRTLVQHLADLSVEETDIKIFSYDTLRSGRNTENRYSQCILWKRGNGAPLDRT